MKNKIIIDIYSDNICPWCYIGIKILQTAISEFSSIEFVLTWRPFQLNPEMPIEGMERNKYLDHKFNGRKNAKKTYELIVKTGLKNNIYFQFEKITITPNSFASHKLLALAHRYNKQTEIVETLFYDYFIEGLNIGNLDELIRIAKHHNMYDKNTLEYLQSDEDKDNLLAEEVYARQLGVTGVPCFIIDKEIVLFGAQDKKIFTDIFNTFSNDK